MPLPQQDKIVGTLETETSPPKIRAFISKHHTQTQQWLCQFTVKASTLMRFWLTKRVQ